MTALSRSSAACSAAAQPRAAAAAAAASSRSTRSCSAATCKPASSRAYRSAVSGESAAGGHCRVSSGASVARLPRPAHALKLGASVHDADRHADVTQ